jgi:hypothetical protein
MPSTEKAQNATESTQANDSTVNKDFRPSRGWYGLAFVIFLIGLAAYTASINAGKLQVQELVNRLQPLTAPGETTVTLEESGLHLVFYEKFGTLDGEPYDLTQQFPVLPKMSLQVTSVALGEVVPSFRVEHHTIYDPPGRMGYSEWQFDAPAAGDYRIKTQLGEEIETDQQFKLTIGPFDGRQFTTDWKGAFGGAAIFAFAFIVAAVTIILTYMLRHGGLNRRT